MVGGGNFKAKQKNKNNMLDKLLNDPKVIELIKQYSAIDILLINIILIALAIYVVVKLFRYILDDD